MDAKVDGQDSNEFGQMLCWWSVVGFFVLFLIGTIPMMQFVPPPSPQLDGAELLARYEDNLLVLRAGILVCIIAAILYVPWSTMIGFQLARLEGKSAVLSVTSVGAGVVNSVAFLIPYIIWAAAFYRPERDSDLILLLNDVTWLEFVIAFSPFMLQLICVGLVGLRYNEKQQVIPRWFSFFSLWVAILVTPGGLALFFYDGPFAWNGILGFYLVLVAFGAYMLAAFSVFRKAILNHKFAIASGSN